MGPSRKGFFLHRFFLSLYLSAFRPRRGLQFLSPKNTAKDYLEIIASQARTPPRFSSANATKQLTAPKRKKKE